MTVVRPWIRLRVRVAVADSVHLVVRNRWSRDDLTFQALLTHTESRVPFLSRLRVLCCLPEYHGSTRQEAEEAAKAPNASIFHVIEINS